MIKHLLNADEEMPDETQVAVEDVVANPPAEAESSPRLNLEEISGNFETQRVLAIPDDVKVVAEPLEAIDDTDEVGEILELNPERMTETVNRESTNLQPPEMETVDFSNFGQSDPQEQADDSSPTLFQSSYKPESPAETIRQSGLAYSAAIILFGSVVFMLILGWFGDQVLGSSPWGLVGGIVLGAIIGFVQFFRITSQIFRK